MIRKGQIRWLPKDDIAGQKLFVGRLFGFTPPHNSWPAVTTEPALLCSGLQHIQPNYEALGDSEQKTNWSARFPRPSLAAHCFGNF